MVVLYSVAMMIGFALLLGVVIQYQNSRIIEGKQEAYDSRVNQFQSFTDHYILDEVYSIMTKDIFDISTYNFEDINNPDIYVYNRNDFEEAKKVLRFLDNLKQNADFINSIDIYNRSHDTYVSSVSGVFYKVKENHHKYKNIINYTLLEDSFNNEYNQFWLNNTQGLYFIQLMPIFKNPESTDIAFIISLNIEKVLNQLFTDINQEREGLRIIDSQKQIIYEAGLSEMDTEQLNSKIIDQIAVSNWGSTTIKVGYKKYSVIWKKSVYNDWTYIYSIAYTDLIMSMLAGSMTISLVSSSIFVALVIVIWKISRWLCVPIYQLVNMSKKKIRNNTSQDDFNIINEAFSNITLELNELGDIIEKNNGLILNNIVSDLISGRVNNLEQLNNRFKILGKKFDMDSIYLMIIKFDSKDYAKLGYEDKEWIPLAMSELLDRYYDHRYRGVFKEVSLFNYEGHLTYVINVEGKSYIKERVHAEEILEILQREQFPKFNIAISTLIKDLSECYNSYQTTLGYFRYSFIYGSYNIFTGESLALYEHSESQFSLDVIKRFSSLIKSNKLEVLKEEVAILFNEIQVQGYSYLYPYNLSVKMIEMIANECKIQSIYTEELGQEKLLDEFSRLTDISECICWFEEKINIYEVYRSQRQVDYQRELVDDILKYIESNTNAHISLSYVADHFNMSTAHFSRMFKEKIGTNFSDFVINSKLDRAARLLVAEPTTKVSDIADEIGYSTLAYFNKLFKEKYGMTPTQYRKLHN